MKKKIDKKLMPNQKEKNIFFAGLGAGMAGGLVGNLLISSFFELANKGGFGNPPTKNELCSIFIISLIMFFGIAIWLYKKIKPVNKIINVC